MIRNESLSCFDKISAQKSAFCVSPKKKKQVTQHALVPPNGAHIILLSERVSTVSFNLVSASMRGSKIDGEFPCNAFVAI